MGTALKILLLFPFLGFFTGHSQSKNSPRRQKILDSAYQAIGKTSDDTTRINAYLFWGTKLNDYAQYSKADSVLKIAVDAALLSNYKKGLAKTYVQLAYTYRSLDLFFKSAQMSKKALINASQVNDKGIARYAYQLLGTAYSEIGDHEKAGIYYLKALKLSEELNSKKGIISALAGLGNVYNYMQIYDKAFYYHRQSLNYLKEINDYLKQSYQYLNCGLDLAGSKKNDLALLYFDSTLNIQRHQKNTHGEAYTNNGIATVLFNKGQTQEAIKTSYQAIKTLETENDYSELSRSFSAIANFYFKINKFDSCEAYYKKNLLLSLRINSYDRVSECYMGLFKLYDTLKKHDLALTYFKKYNSLKDSLSGLKAQSKVEGLLDDFENEKKERERNFKDKIIAQENKAQLEKEKNIRNFSVVIGSVILLFGLLLFRALRLKQKANVIITEKKNEVESQKQIIEEKQKEILDSINYAKRIQQSLLPSEKNIEKNLNRLNEKE